MSQVMHTMAQMAPPKLRLMDLVTSNEGQVASHTAHWARASSRLRYPDPETAMLFDTSAGGP